MKDLGEVSYYQGIYDDHVILGNGDLVVGFNIFYKPIWTAELKYFDELHESMDRLIKRLPDNAIAHFQTCVYDENNQVELNQAENDIVLEDMRKWSEKKVMQMYHRLYITFSNEKINKISKTDNPLVRMKNYLFDQPFKDIDKKLEEWRLAINSIDKVLSHNSNVTASRMKKTELLDAIYSYQNQCYDQIDRINGNYVNDDILFEHGEMKIGNEYVAVISLVKEGENLMHAIQGKVNTSEVDDCEVPDHIELPVSMPFPLTIGMPFAHIYNVAIEKVSNKDAIDVLSKERSQLKMLAMANMGKAIRKRDEIGGLKSRTGEILSNGIIDQVEEQNLQFVRTRVNIVVKDRSYGRLVDKIEYVRNAFAEMNDSVAITENGHLLNLFFASAPGCMRFNYRTLWQVNYQCIHYIMKESLYFSDKEGIRFSDRLGRSIKVNTWENEHIVARNGVIFAPTGSGKSVLLNHIINQYQAADFWVIVIDVGGSFKRNTIVNGGYYFDAADSKNLQFNIFICDQDKEGNYLFQPDDEIEDGDKRDEPKRKDDQVNFVASILLKIWKDGEKISKEQKAALKKSVVLFYQWVNKNKKFPDMKLYYQFLEAYKKKAGQTILKYFDIDGLRLVLDDYVTGQHKQLLNSKDNVKLSENKFMVFDLEAIKSDKEINEIVIAIIMHYSSEIIMKKKGRKAYIIDEAIDYLKGDMGEFIAGQYRKIRKKEGQMMISTQGIGYLLGLDSLIRKSILGNSSLVWLLSHEQDKESYPLLRENLSLSNSEMAMLDSLGRVNGARELLLKMGSSYANVLRLELSKFSLLAYSTTPEEVNRMEHHYSKSKNHLLAIKDYMDELKSKNYEKNEN